MLGIVWGPKAWPSVYTWLGTIWKAISYPLRYTERKVEQLGTDIKGLKDQHLSMGLKLDLIVEQFSPNGGSTLKDSLNRIESKQAINEVMSTFMANSIDEAMFKTDSNGLCTWVSKSYLDLVGRSLDDVKDWGWTLILHPEDSARVNAEWNLAVEGKRQFESKYRIVKTNGTYLYVQGKAIPSIFNKKVVAWVGVLEVLNERG